VDHDVTLCCPVAFGRAGTWDAAAKHVFVYASARPIAPQLVAAYQSLHPDVLILSRDVLLRMYGPTMTRAYGFALHLLQQDLLDAAPSHEEDHGPQTTSVGSDIDGSSPAVAPL
jgi:hypothetical protein